MLLVVLLLVTSCGVAAEETVTVLGPWDPGGKEGKAFLATLDRFTRDTGIEVRYRGVRTVNAILRLSDLAGSAPDVAVLSSPAELARYARAGRLARLPRDPGVQERQYLALDDPARPYGVVVKTDLKSLVWYDRTVGTAAAAPFTSFADLVERGQQVRARGGVVPWCIGVKSGAESGWPGTDWIEDILLHLYGADAYERWARGDLAWTSAEVRGAWLAWHRLLETSGMLTQSRTMLLTAWNEHPPTPCAMEHQASFLRPQGWGVHPFPGDNSAVSVDVAGLFHDRPAARRLLAFLASRQGQQEWTGRAGGGFFSPRTDLDRAAAYRGDDIGLLVANRLAGSSRCLDGSDFMPQAVGTAFATAVLEFLADPRAEALDGILGRVEEVRRSVPPADWLRDACS
ncbi:ABC transporter substrate-binding protein [Virgisporangium aliadipatigenens]|uniref:ABC transporter substrate-binding protein n=2 Tax=Virgisporangium aliadipatigenens TaxID=741659 RepID=A0A8J4DNJ6_9ACTN|nr:ABC transporter substrate-binding protein [Virgisporangium aliadipatigenens]